MLVFWNPKLNYFEAKVIFIKLSKSLTGLVMIYEMETD